MKNKISKFISFLLLILFFVCSYQTVLAANLRNWKKDVYSYSARYGYIVNGKYEQRWLLYDTTGKYEDIYCVRSGDRQHSSYEEVDLYSISEEMKNELFASENDYKQFMWMLENMYLYGDAQTDKMSKYNTLIGATSLPYETNKTIENVLFNPERTNKTYLVTRNEQLIKTVQNEILLEYVKQTKQRNVDINNIYGNKFVSGNNVGQALTGAPHDYALKIVNRFKNTDNASNYIVENKNKGFGTDNYAGQVSITSSTENADWNNGISGEFIAKNKFNANITDVKVYVNNRELKSNYSFVDMQGNDITNKIKENLTNKASSEDYKFRVKYEGANSGDNVKVTLSVDYGYITKASLLIPTEETTNGKNNQYMINVSREKETETVSTEQEVFIKEFDLALTKQIIKVEDRDYRDSRLKGIDIGTISNTKTARYMMDKTSVPVEDGDIVKYKITVYNEGDIDGYAQQIKDYIPEGLEFVNSTDNTKYGWKMYKADGTETTEVSEAEYVATNYLSKENSTTENSTLLKAFMGGNSANSYMQFNEASKSIELELKVVATQEMKEEIEKGVNVVELDNRAEISIYGYETENGFVEANSEGIDRDSIQDSVISDSAQNGISDLLGKIKDMIKDAISKGKFEERYGDKAIIAYEDDDDIERLRLVIDSRVFDLALRKWIVQVDETSYANRAPSQFGIIDTGLTVQLLKEGTLPYDNPKDAIKVQLGSKVTYKIGIYNEGTRNGYAQEITDYLPQGLEFVEDDPTNIANGWVATKNEDGTTTVKTTKLSKENGKQDVIYDANGNEDTNVTDEFGNKYNENLIMHVSKNYAEAILGRTGFDSYKEIEIVCKVSENLQDTSYLTNRAEITKYGYETEDGFVEANAEGIDLDSVQDTIKNDLSLDTWYFDNYDEVNPKDNYPGVEDDDDFETVYVEMAKYTLQIRKVNSYDNSVIDGVVFNVNGQKTSPTVNGITKIVEKAFGENNSSVVDTYLISEIDLGKASNYIKVAETITVYVKKSADLKVSEVSFENNKNVTTKQAKLEDGTTVNLELSIEGNIVTVVIPNKPNGFDLSLRKFITKVNETELTGEQSREPVVDTSKLKTGESTTATYTHTKEPVEVSPKDIVTYTLRIYNEGMLDGYAKLIMDDVPQGVQMVAPAYDEQGIASNLNAKYGWEMYKELAENEQEGVSEQDIIKYNEKVYIKTQNAEEAVLIVTNYLSKENGEKIMASTGANENPNLLKAYNAQTDTLSYKDIEVEFKVKASNEEDKIIINYAQITDDEYADGTDVTDRDSTPTEWIEGEDDQDIEKIKVRYFDLALYKWVSSTLVTENGKTKEIISEHTQDDKSKLVNVTIPKDNLDETIVKFKYEIKVENQGNLEGYAKEIKDHIPEGLKFVAEDNKDFGWVIAEDEKTITTDYLKDTLLKPGETATVQVVLTWINGENNLGEKWNYAEISEDYNEYDDADDIDSTPDNFKDKPVEDDEDGDMVMLNVRTGGMNVIYIVLGVSVALIISAGVIGIKKFVV